MCGWWFFCGGWVKARGQQQWTCKCFRIRVQRHVPAGPGITAGSPTLPPTHSTQIKSKPSCIAYSQRQTHRPPTPTHTHLIADLGVGVALLLQGLHGGHHGGDVHACGTVNVTGSTGVRCSSGRQHDRSAG